MPVASNYPQIVRTCRLRKMVSTKALRLGHIADSEQEGGTPPGLLQLLPNGAGMPFHLRYQRQQKKWEKKKKKVGVSVCSWPMGSWNRIIICAREADEVMLRSRALESELG